MNAAEAPGGRRLQRPARGAIFADALGRMGQKRPLALAGLCLALGCALAACGSVPHWIWGALCAFLAALALLARRRELVWPLIAFIGAFAYALALMGPAVAPVYGATVEGVVSERPEQRPNSARVYLSDVSIDGSPLGAGLAAYAYDEAIPGALALRVGERVCLTGNVYPPSEAGNAGAFSFAAFLRRKGIVACASARGEIDVVSSAGFTVRGWFSGLQARLAGELNLLFDEDCAPLASALLLGVRAELPEELTEAFAASGAAHLLALSGMHVTCLAGYVALLMALFRLRGRALAIGVSLSLAFYALLTGLSPSVARAAIMYALFMAARAEGRPYDSLSALGAALIAVLAVNPLLIGDARLVMSFCASGGITLLRAVMPYRQPRSPLDMRRAGNLICVSASAILGAFPATVAFYGTASAYALAVNLAAVPLATLSLPLCAASLLLGWFYPLGRALALAAQLPLRAITWLTAYVARLPGAQVSLPEWPVWLMALYAAALIFSAPEVTRSKKARHLAFLALPAMILVSLIPRGLGDADVRVVFLDVGQASACSIELGGDTYMIDVGEDGDAADYLRSGGRAPKAIFLTHAHADHVGGLAAIVESFPPATLYATRAFGGGERDEAADDALNEALAAGWELVYLDEGARIALSPEVALCVVADGAPSPDENTSSPVLLLSYGEADALFLGDMPMESETLPAPDVELLAVPHHGSNGSTSPLLLESASPSVAVISVGARNSYGMPAEAVLNRLEKSGAAIYRTDESGAVSVTLKPDGALAVETYR